MLKFEIWDSFWIWVLGFGVWAFVQRLRYAMASSAPGSGWGSVAGRTGCPPLAKRAGAGLSRAELESVAPPLSALGFRNRRQREGGYRRKQTRHQRAALLAEVGSIRLPCLEEAAPLVHSPHAAETHGGSRVCVPSLLLRHGGDARRECSSSFPVPWARRKDGDSRVDSGVAEPQSTLGLATRPESAHVRRGRRHPGAGRGAPRPSKPKSADSGWSARCDSRLGDQRSMGCLVA